VESIGLLFKENIMKQFYMLIGIPASGKSTWVEHFMKYKNVNDVYIYSTDNHIESMAKEAGTTYSKGFSKFVKKAETKAKYGLKEALKNGVKYIIWDQTNLTPKTRAKKLAQIPDEYSKVGIVFDIPEERELQRRLDSRPGKELSNAIMNSMKHNYVVPMISEGFDSVVNIKEVSNYKG